LVKWAFRSFHFYLAGHVATTDLAILGGFVKMVATIANRQDSLGFCRFAGLESTRHPFANLPCKPHHRGRNAGVQGVAFHPHGWDRDSDIATTLLAYMTPCFFLYLGHDEFAKFHGANINSTENVIWSPLQIPKRIVAAVQ
jgi:hypothetical protein